MRVAVPALEGRTSPVFDWAPRLLVVDHDGHEEQARREVLLEAIPPPLRPGRLAELGVEVLLCGGISRPILQMIYSHDITVFAGLAGDVEALLQAYFDNKLPHASFELPGWRRRRRRRRRGGRQKNRR